jgi:CRISPR-associated endonuclease/helicase Cas3
MRSDGAIGEGVARTYYAHSLHGRPEAEWEPLVDHLTQVSALAAEFADAFGAGAYGRLAGLWHDLGKYSDEFQRYLRQTSDADASSEGLRGRVDHSTAGAQHADAALPTPANRLIAYCIAGHHAGLPDFVADSEGCLERRLTKTVPNIKAAPGPLLEWAPPPLPALQWATGDERNFQAALFCRLIFSCLVDGDFLATETFLAPERATARPHPRRLRDLDAELQGFLLKKSATAPKTTVNAVRHEVLTTCLKSASLPAGLFSLTVPTGGGKTLSSLAFALRHAVIHGQRRIIYAVPFTSIIEQNADVFREALAPLGPDVVLEHHSAVDSADPHTNTLWSRLAAENWDAPLVVTTNVQFFESLFAARPGRCRKLHRIVGSVIVLDEVQTLPVQLLAPSLALLRELVRNYHCSIILCSATQPAVQRRNGFDIGLEGVHELVPDRSVVFGAMRRTTVDYVGRMSDVDLAASLAREQQALCVVNTKVQAATLFDRLPVDVARYHLSAGMCPQHRSEVLAVVKRRLRTGEPCVLVSTQVVEAGVDIDFPVVYRAMTGVDSIAQAAGRCNREGRLANGRVLVFEPEDPIPAGELRQAAETARELLGRFDDLLSPAAVEAYFTLHYWKRKDEWDRRRVLECFKPGGHLDFKEAAERYRLISEEQRPIIIPWGEAGRRLVDRVLGGEPPNRDLCRRLQRFTVSNYPRAWDALVASGAIVVESEIFSVLVQEKLYDKAIGLRRPISGAAWDPDELIV